MRRGEVELVPDHEQAPVPLAVLVGHLEVVREVAVEGLRGLRVLGRHLLATCVRRREEVLADADLDLPQVRLEGEQLLQRDDVVLVQVVDLLGDPRGREGLHDAADDPRQQQQPDPEQELCPEAAQRGTAAAAPGAGPVRTGRLGAVVLPGRVVDAAVRAGQGVGVHAAAPRTPDG